MSISLFKLFSIGIGPSSSHTVGPMRAANAFVHQLGDLSSVSRIQIDLYGSLALTGKGHGTDKAILNGLENKTPETVEPDTLIPRMQAIMQAQKINLGGTHSIPFHEKTDFLFHQKEVLPKHTNGMRFSAFDKNKKCILEVVYYSIGGGFIVTEAEYDKALPLHTLPYPFSNAETLLQLCKTHGLSIAELTLKNECATHTETEVKKRIEDIAAVMQSCITHGCQTAGTLPGGLHVKRRAKDLYEKLLSQTTKTQSIFEASDIMNRLNVYAIAVNEENAAGDRVVTAPTNGAAGIIPAVMRYFQEAHNKTTKEDLYTYFLTASAIGSLYKQGASISGAEVGCQGEVGVASSMAAGALTAVLGGSVEQVENAAEIAMEHHLGMTCDPVMGLVQIPCIERNAMGAVKAVNAARMALMGDGQHFVSLDKVIRTMKQTGKDMMTIYKETSLGGLAVNHPEC